MRKAAFVTAGALVCVWRLTVCPVLADSSVAPATARSGPRIVAACDFEGPYNTYGSNQIHAGWGNGGFGRRDMLFRAEQNSGRSGTVQAVYIRGITSGCLQFYYARLKSLTKGRFYRVSWWMKGDGLEGRIRPQIRGIGHWTVYLSGAYERPGNAWKRYAFSGPCPQDAPGDISMMLECGSIGAFWLDDLLVEESDQPFPPETVAAPQPPEPAGNLLPRSSFEGLRDHLWCGAEMGHWTAGVWHGVETDWDDPQMYRAPASVPGKFGKYCLALPAASHPAAVATHSKLFEVRPGQPYTLSAWMRTSDTNAGGSVGFVYWWGGAGHGHPVKVASAMLGPEWRRIVATGIPQHAPGVADTNAPMKVFLQIGPSSSSMTDVTVYADGIQFEAGTNATPYQPRYPIELYADVGQPGGNLIEWGQKVPLCILAAAADTALSAPVEVEVTLTGFPGVPVHRELYTLAVDQPLRLDFDPRRRGLFRVDLRTLDASLAAPQEFLFAIVPKPRGTGERGMFGTHIALRPFLVDYVRRLGFTWTRIHDCSGLTKWHFTEPKRGQLAWHDAVVDGVRQGGLNILALPDDPPEWAKTAPTNGAIQLDFEAFGQYCEAASRHYRGKISHWEIWNEPYMQSNYGGGPTNFGKVMQTAYAALKRGNPDCKVAGWSADIGNPGWGARLPEEARKCIDVFTFHNYVFNATGSGTLPFAVELPEHRKLFDTTAVRECWNTEGTYAEVCGNSFYTFLPTAGPEINDLATAFAARVWMEHAKSGVSKYFVYQMHNTDSPMYMGGYQSLLISYDRSPTPAAVAAATTAYAMDGLKCLPFTNVTGVVQALFAGEGRATWAVYDDGAVVGRRALKLAALPGDAEVFDVMGNDPRRDGKQLWEIGVQPLFVLSSQLDAAELAKGAQAAIAD